MTAAVLTELDRLLPLTDDDSLCQMQSLLWLARADLIDATKKAYAIIEALDETVAHTTAVLEIAFAGSAIARRAGPQITNVS